MSQHTDKDRLINRLSHDIVQETIKELKEVLEILNNPTDKVTHRTLQQRLPRVTPRLQKTTEKLIEIEEMLGNLQRFLPDDFVIPDNRNYWTLD